MRVSTLIEGLQRVWQKGRGKVHLAIGSLFSSLLMLKSLDSRDDTASVPLFLNIFFTNALLHLFGGSQSFWPGSLYTTVLRTFFADVALEQCKDGCQTTSRSSSSETAGLRAKSLLPLCQSSLIFRQTGRCH